tara:strand:+ start:2026 stop:2586 length:561 start_codon:yes stop_codon:yes gene_type:complete
MKINWRLWCFTLLAVLLVVGRVSTEAAEVDDESAGIGNEKVFLIGLSYDNGRIKLNEMIAKIGYAPDRKLQPDEGFRGEMVSFEEEVLYSFRFDVPLKINTDVIDNNEVSGNVIVLNETNFALLVPYFEETKEINIYDENDERVFSAKVYKPSAGNRRWLLMAVIGLIVGGVFMVVYLGLRKKRKK